jgi:hypothetical protein
MSEIIRQQNTPNQTVFTAISAIKEMVKNTISFEQKTRNNLYKRVKSFVAQNPLAGLVARNLGKISKN